MISGTYGVYLFRSGTGEMLRGRVRSRQEEVPQDKSREALSQVDLAVVASVHQPWANRGPVHAIQARGVPRDNI